MATANESTPKDPSYFPGTFQKDFISSIVVFLVALPLCVGIAVAVGADPARALITGIVGGLIVGIFSGSPLQVSGPAAGLFVIVADILTTQEGKFNSISSASDGSAELNFDALTYKFAALGVAVFLAGLMQILAGQLMLGRWFQAVSPAVIKGMLAGIGVLIIISQFHVMLDHDAMIRVEPGDDHAHSAPSTDSDEETSDDSEKEATEDGEGAEEVKYRKAHGGLEYIATIPDAIKKCFYAPDEGRHHHLAAALGIITIVIIVLWQSFAPSALKLIPAALLGVVVASILDAALGFPDLIVLSVPESLADEITMPSMLSVEFLTHSDIWVNAVVIALVASAETLLCATAVDKMKVGHKTKHDQELTAQGIGNSICGLLGALPMTGVIVRSSANVNAGGETRGATIMHGFWLLLFIAVIPGVLAFVPRATLGALLVYTGFKLVNVKQIQELWKTSRLEFAIYAATVILIVSFDLLVGVVAGIVLSAIKLLLVFTRLGADLQVDEQTRKAQLWLSGVATFLNLPILSAKLEEVPEDAELHVDLNGLSYVDHACLELLMDWAKVHEKSGGTLVIDWDMLHGKFKQDKSANGSNGSPGTEIDSKDASNP